MDDLLGRLDPTAVGVDVGEELDGLDDGIGGDVHIAGVLDDVAESVANVAVALSEQAGGVRVAIQRAARNFVFGGDAGDAFPTDEGAIDFSSDFAGADGAVSLVELEAGQGLGYVSPAAVLAARSNKRLGSFSCGLMGLRAGLRWDGGLRWHGRFSFGVR